MYRLGQIKTIVSLLLLAGAVNGAEPAVQAPKAARTDRLGDPLPDGSIARLGSTRMRPGASIGHLAFSPDGTLLASFPSFTQSGLSIWDVKTGREVRRVELAHCHVLACAWHSDRHGVVVLQLGDDSFYVWDFVDEKAERPPAIVRPNFRISNGVAADDETYSRFAISANGKRIAAGRSGQKDRARSIDLLEVAAGKRIKDLKKVFVLGPQEGNCNGLAFSAEGTSLFVLSRDRTAKDDHLAVYDVKSGVSEPFTVPKAMEQGYLKAFAIAPDGDSIALGLPDGTVRIWDVKEKKEVRSIGKHVGKGPNDKGISALAFGPGGKTMITAGRDRKVRVWETANGKELRLLHEDPGWVEAIALSPDGKRIATAGRMIRIWDADTGTDACPLSGHVAGVFSAAVTADGRTALTTGFDLTLRSWNLNDAREERRVNLSPGKYGPLLLSPDGESLIAGDCTLLDPRTGEPGKPPGEFAKARGRPLRFTTDNRSLLTSDKGTVSVWDWPTGKLKRKVEIVLSPADPAFNIPANRGEASCNDANLSPDGKMLAISSDRFWTSKRGDFVQGNSMFNAAEMFDADNGRLLRKFEKPPSSPKFAFTRDGRWLILAGGIQLAYKEGPEKFADAVSLWDPLTGKKRRSFALPKTEGGLRGRSINAIALSPDGRTLAAAEEDNSLVLFEVATGEVRRRMLGHRSHVWSLTFTPDGKRLISTSDDETALVWDVSLAALAPAKAVQPSEQEAKQLWAELAGEHTDAAYRAMSSLAAVPETTVELMKKRVIPAPETSNTVLNRIFVELNGDDFKAREDASAELDRLGEAAIVGVRTRLARGVSEEVGSRAEKFLLKHERDIPAPDRLREERAIEVLEQINAPASRALLAELAKGGAGAALTRDAAAALARLRKP